MNENKFSQYFYTLLLATLFPDIDMGQSYFDFC